MKLCVCCITYLVPILVKEGFVRQSTANSTLSNPHDLSSVEFGSIISILNVRYIIYNIQGVNEKYT